MRLFTKLFAPQSPLSKYVLTQEGQPLFCAPRFPAEKAILHNPAGEFANRARSHCKIPWPKSRKRYRAALQKVDTKKASRSVKR
jgi:hypothetical protein